MLIATLLKRQMQHGKCQRVAKHHIGKVHKHRFRPLRNKYSMQMYANKLITLSEELEKQQEKSGRKIRKHFRFAGGQRLREINQRRRYVAAERDENLKKSMVITGKSSIYTQH